MKYTEEDVLDIIKYLSKEKDPKFILKEWGENKANEPLDLKGYEYPLFVYSFPIEVDDEELAIVTLVELYNTGIDNKMDSIMPKYMGFENYKNSWDAFSHKTYLHCFLDIKKEIKLPPHPESENFYLQESSFKDSENNIIKYNISYGDVEEDKQWIRSKYSEDINDFNLYWFDNGVNIQIEKKDIKGWELGKKINENVEQRKRINKTF